MSMRHGQTDEPIRDTPFEDGPSPCVVFFFLPRQGVVRALRWYDISYRGLGKMKMASDVGLEKAYVKPTRTVVRCINMNGSHLGIH